MNRTSPINSRGNIKKNTNDQNSSDNILYRKQSTIDSVSKRTSESSRGKDRGLVQNNLLSSFMTSIPPSFRGIFETHTHMELQENQHHLITQPSAYSQIIQDAFKEVDDSKVKDSQHKKSNKISNSNNIQNLLTVQSAHHYKKINDSNLMKINNIYKQNLVQKARGQQIGQKLDPLNKSISNDQTLKIPKTSKSSINIQQNFSNQKTLLKDQSSSNYQLKRHMTPQNSTQSFRINTVDFNRTHSKLKERNINSYENDKQNWKSFNNDTSQILMDRKGSQSQEKLPQLNKIRTYLDKNFNREKSLNSDQENINKPISIKIPKRKSNTKEKFSDDSPEAVAMTQELSKININKKFSEKKIYKEELIQKIQEQNQQDIQLGNSSIDNSLSSDIQQNGKKYKMIDSIESNFHNKIQKLDSNQNLKFFTNIKEQRESIQFSDSQIFHTQILVEQYLEEIYTYTIQNSIENQQKMQEETIDILKIIKKQKSLNLIIKPIELHQEEQLQQNSVEKLAQQLIQAPINDIQIDLQAITYLQTLYKDILINQSVTNTNNNLAIQNNNKGIRKPYEKSKTLVMNFGKNQKFGKFNQNQKRASLFIQEPSSPERIINKIFVKDKFQIAMQKDGALQFDITTTKNDDISLHLINLNELMQEQLYPNQGQYRLNYNNKEIYGHYNKLNFKNKIQKQELNFSKTQLQYSRFFNQEKTKVNKREKVIKSRIGILIQYTGPNKDQIQKSTVESKNLLKKSQIKIKSSRRSQSKTSLNISEDGMSNSQLQNINKLKNNFTQYFKLAFKESQENKKETLSIKKNEQDLIDQRASFLSTQNIQNQNNQVQLDYEKLQYVIKINHIKDINWKQITNYESYDPTPKIDTQSTENLIKYEVFLQKSNQEPMQLLGNSLNHDTQQQELNKKFKEDVIYSEKHIEEEKKVRKQIWNDHWRNTKNQIIEFLENKISTNFFQLAKKSDIYLKILEKNGVKIQEENYYNSEFRKWVYSKYKFFQMSVYKMEFIGLDQPNTYIHIYSQKLTKQNLLMLDTLRSDDEETNDNQLNFFEFLYEGNEQYFDPDKFINDFDYYNEVAENESNIQGQLRPIPIQEKIDTKERTQQLILPVQSGLNEESRDQILQLHRNQNIKLISLQVDNVLNKKYYTIQNLVNKINPDQLEIYNITFLEQYLDIFEGKFVRDVTIKVHIPQTSKRDHQIPVKQIKNEEVQIQQKSEEVSQTKIRQRPHALSMQKGSNYYNDYFNSKALSPENLKSIINSPMLKPAISRDQSKFSKIVPSHIINNNLNNIFKDMKSIGNKELEQMAQGLLGKDINEGSVYLSKQNTVKIEENTKNISFNLSNNKEQQFLKVLSRSLKKPLDNQQSVDEQSFMEIQKTSSMDKRCLAIRSSEIADRHMKKLTVAEQLQRFIKINKVHEFIEMYELHHVHTQDIRDENGNNFLLISAQCDNVQVMEYLISKGVNIDDQNDDGNTALHLANVHNNYECSDLLVSTGANQYIQNKFKQNPWDIEYIQK